MTRRWVSKFLPGAERIHRGRPPKAHNELRSVDSVTAIQTVEHRFDGSTTYLHAIAQLKPQLRACESKVTIFEVEHIIIAPYGAD